MKQNIKLEKQYGIVNKEILKNKNISANTKGLYVYLCARSGNKGICNPSIDTICKDLNINEATFHKAKRELLSNNIISIEKKGNGIQKRNYYILTKQDNKGYGIIYLDIAINPKLTLKAKAIYGLLSCLAGMRFVAYPKARTIYSILQISRNTYFTTLKMLKDLRYIITKQLHINGRFAQCNYYINGKEPNKKETRYIFKGLKNTTTKTNYTNNTYKGVQAQVKDYQVYKDMIISNIEYNALIGLFNGNKKALYILDNILTILTNDTYSDNVKSLVINDTKLNGSVVKSIFSKLNFNNIKYVVDNILKTNSKIKNIKKYLRVSLANSYYQLEQLNYNAMRGF